jgi:hypothetical protein
MAPLGPNNMVTHGGPKKWMMLQMWRVQQVAQLLSLAMLALTLSLQVWGYVKWRPLFNNSWSGILMILLALAAVIWVISFLWDIRFKMWREQTTVLMERNPYAKEKLNAKEVALYKLTWLPVMDRLAKDDPKVKEAADILRAWIKKVEDIDPILRGDLEDIEEHIGMK